MNYYFSFYFLFYRLGPTQNFLFSVLFVFFFVSDYESFQPCEQQRKKITTLFKKLLILKLLRKKHLSTVINNNMEPPLMCSVHLLQLWKSLFFPTTAADFFFTSSCLRKLNVSWSFFVVAMKAANIFICCVSTSKRVKNGSINNFARY